MMRNKNAVENRSTKIDNKWRSKDSIKEWEAISYEVLASLRDGDRDAYEKVYVTWRQPIHAIISRLVGSDADAEDIVQDVFIAVWNNREKIDPSKDIRALLYVMSRNAAMQIFRQKKIQNDFVSKYQFDLIDFHTSYDLVVEKESLLLAELVVSRMPKQRRNIYEMSQKKNMTPEQIAKELNISRETVHNQLSLAKRDIRDIITMLMVLLMPFK